MEFKVNRVKLSVAVPPEGVEEVRKAICEAGAGVLGNYTFCSMTTECIGTFRPDENAEPYIGENRELNRVKEVKLETFCDVKDVKKIVTKLREVHPYEEPSIEIIPLLDEDYFE